MYSPTAIVMIGATAGRPTVALTVTSAQERLRRRLVAISVWNSAALLSGSRGPSENLDRGWFDVSNGPNSG